MAIVMGAQAWDSQRTRPSTRMLSIIAAIASLGMVCVLVFAPLAMSAAPEPAISAVHLSYVGDTATSIAVTWRAPEVVVPEDAWVEAWVASVDASGENGLGESTRVMARGRARTYKYARENVVIYSALLTGLKPDTRYRYVIHCLGEVSPEFEFRTGPVGEGDPEFTFAVMGDSRGGYEIFARLMRMAREEGARFVLFTGDMTDGASQAEWNAWFSTASDTLPYLPLMPVHGNHEMMSRTYFNQFTLPGDGMYYSFDFGRAHFAIVLDIEGRLRTGGASWLESDLRSSAATWKFVALHKPFYSGSPAWDGVTYPREILEPIVDAGGVSVVFAGHVHAYERTYPMLYGKPADEGIVHVITGGAGAPLVDAGYSGFTAAATSVYHLVIVRVSPTRLAVVAKAVDGTVMDEFVVFPRTAR